VVTHVPDSTDGPGKRDGDRLAARSSVASAPGHELHRVSPHTRKQENLQTGELPKRLQGSILMTAWASALGMIMAPKASPQENRLNARYG